MRVKSIGRLVYKKSNKTFERVVQGFCTPPGQIALPRLTHRRRWCVSGK